MPAPKLSPYLEDKLKLMFSEIQEPFEKHCPPTRKNFLSYSYVLYKFCELLGEVSAMFKHRCGRVAYHRNAAFVPNAGCSEAALSTAQKCGEAVCPGQHLEEHMQRAGLGVHSFNLMRLHGDHVQSGHCSAEHRP